MCLTKSQLFTKFQQIDKTEVLSRHNYWRSQVVPQSRQPLPDLQWDDDLARAAAGWAAQCNMKHDSSNNRDLPDRGDNKGPWVVGQNICFATPARSFTDCIDDWASERHDWTYGIGKTGNGPIGHYTQ